MNQIKKPRNKLFRIIFILCLIILDIFFLNVLYQFTKDYILNMDCYKNRNDSCSWLENRNIIFFINNLELIYELVLISSVLLIIHYHRLELWIIKLFTKIKSQFRWEKISKIKKFNPTVQFILRITIFLFLMILNTFIFKLLYELIDEYILEPNCLWIWHYHCRWFYWWYGMDILNNFKTIYAILFFIFTIWLAYYFLWSDIKKIWDIRKIRFYHIRIIINDTKQILKNTFKKNKK